MDETRIAGRDAHGPNRGRAFPRIHLASKSPRRRELLLGAGIEHDAAHPGVDDGLLAPGAVSPDQWVMALAYLKASTAARALAHRAEDAAPIIILGADTIVVHRGTLMGQPTDLAHARRMILAMRDDVHDVVTGVALLDPEAGTRDLFVDRAVVSVGHIPDSDIESYLASESWRGKAGAYNLSERLQAGWPIEYTGDAGTIMGLPIAKLVDKLRRWGIKTR